MPARPSASRAVVVRAASSQAPGTSPSMVTGPAAPTVTLPRPAQAPGQLLRGGMGVMRGHEATTRPSCSPTMDPIPAAAGCDEQGPAWRLADGLGNEHRVRTSRVHAAGAGPRLQGAAVTPPVMRSETRSVRTRCSASAAVRSNSSTRAVTTAARSSVLVGVVEAVHPAEDENTQVGLGGPDGDGPHAAGVCQAPRLARLEDCRGPGHAGLPVAA